MKTNPAPNQNPSPRHNHPSQIQRQVTSPRPASNRRPRPTTAPPRPKVPFLALFDFLALSPSLSSLYAAAAAATPPRPVRAASPIWFTAVRLPPAREAEACRFGPPVQRGALRASDDVSVPNQNPSLPIRIWAPVPIRAGSPFRSLRSICLLIPHVSIRWLVLRLVARLCLLCTRSVSACVARSELFCGFSYPGRAGFAFSEVRFIGDAVFVVVAWMAVLVLDESDERLLFFSRAACLKYSRLVDCHVLPLSFRCRFVSCV
jgi:hypothetical protein